VIQVTVEKYILVDDWLRGWGLTMMEQKMEVRLSAERTRLWISYPWITNEERDFTYLVSQLKESNIDATYDAFQLAPGSQLSQRVVQRLLSIGFDGWMYILTHHCIARKVYTDELTTAIDQTLARMGSDFPMLGLMYGIASNHVPPALRALPCISLGDQNWKGHVSAILKPGVSRRQKEHGSGETRFIWKIHSCYEGNPELTAFEVFPKNDVIQYWRFATPKAVRPVKWGQGRAGNGQFSRSGLAEAEGFGRYGKNDIAWFGSADTVSGTESAYAVFSEPLPEFICFGPAQSAFGPPVQMEVFWCSLASRKQ
jgi:hypothetical protein